MWADLGKSVKSDDIRAEQRKVLDIWEPIVVEAMGRRPSYLPSDEDGDEAASSSGDLGSTYMEDDEDDDHMEL